MLKRISQLAERAATNASRRQFLIRSACFGGGLAAALAALLLPRPAEARSSGSKFCYYICDLYGETWETKKVSCSKECPQQFRDCYFQYSESYGC